MERLEETDGIKNTACRSSRPGQLCKEQLAPRAYSLALPYGTDPTVGLHPCLYRIPCIRVLEALGWCCCSSRIPATPFLGASEVQWVGQDSDGRGKEGTAGS